MKKLAVCIILMLFSFQLHGDDIDYTEICRSALRSLFGYSENLSGEDSGYEIINSRPLFVTLQINNRTRGCAGTFQPLFADIREELAYFTINAATRDFRYPAVRFSELEDITIIVTFPGEPVFIDSLVLYNPWEDGLLVRKSGREGVILPCEGKTASYSMRKAISQAGISSLEGADIYVFECETIVEDRR